MGEYGPAKTVLAGTAAITAAASAIKAVINRGERIIYVFTSLCYRVNTAG